MKNTKFVCCLIALCLLNTSFKVFSQQTITAADLAGVWGCERVFGPEVRGPLTILKRGAEWRASIAGFDAPARFDKGEISFSLASNRGEFRGWISRDASRITGHWIQPRTVLSGSRYATPVELKAVESNVWSGQVAPLEDRVSLYLVLQPQPDGSYKAFIRNPERNVGVFMRFERATLEGDSVHFKGQNNNELIGKLDRDNGILSIFVPRFSTTFDFTLRKRDEAAGFYTRTPEASTYVYQKPLMETDGWVTASLADVGLDSKPLSSLVQNILQTKTDALATPYLQGLLIARHGKLALEEYFYGFHKDRVHDTRSAGKSLTSTLVGIAIDKGAHFDVTTPVYLLFPNYTSFAHDDARKRKLTVEHLLTMSSGYDCDDSNSSSPGNEDVMNSQTEQPDFYKYTLDLPMVRNPGERAVYCSAGINLLGGIVTNTTGKWLPDFLYENFARPMDIHTYHMNLTPTGNGYGAGGIYLRPRDFLKLGQLFLAGGRWNGRQVVSRKWVERATEPYLSINSENKYGYAWWIKDYSVGGKTYRAFYAAGNGGQFVIVLPQLDLVVMFAGGNYSNGAVSNKWRDELVPQFIIPSAIR